MSWRGVAGVVARSLPYRTGGTPSPPALVSQNGWRRATKPLTRETQVTGRRFSGDRLLEARPETPGFDGRVQSARLSCLPGEVAAVVTTSLANAADESAGRGCASAIETGSVGSPSFAGFPAGPLARTIHEDHAPERTRSPSSALRLLCEATAGHSQSRLDLWRSVLVQEGPLFAGDGCRVRTAPRSCAGRRHGVRDPHE